MFSFRDLNLTNIKESSGALTLKPGTYTCKVNEAKIDKIKSGGQQLVVKLSDTEGQGSITDWIVVNNPNSEMNTRIGLERLKSLLVHGGHKDPDNIGQHGVESIKGLVVGVQVKSEPWTNDKGKTVDGSRVHYYFKIEDGNATQPADAGGFDDMKDDIPY